MGPISWVQPTGCGACPNLFADESYNFGANPKKSDEPVKLWCLLREQHNRTGALQYQDKRVWTRSLFRCSLSENPKLRIVTDFSYPLNAFRAQFNLPVIKRIERTRNYSFLGSVIFCDCPGLRADFAPTFGFDDIQTHDVSGMDNWPLLTLTFLGLHLSPNTFFGPSRYKQCLVPQIRLVVPHLLCGNVGGAHFTTLQVFKSNTSQVAESVSTTPKASGLGYRTWPYMILPVVSVPKQEVLSIKPGFQISYPSWIEICQVCDFTAV